MCTEQSHTELKLDAERWAVEVEVIGEIDVGDGSVVVFANCRACQSTLAIARRESPR
jgi:hypothetical protein